MKNNMKKGKGNTLGDSALSIYIVSWTCSWFGEIEFFFPESLKVIVLLLVISFGKGDSLLIVLDIMLLTIKLLFYLE